MIICEWQKKKIENAWKIYSLNQPFQQVTLNTHLLNHNNMHELQSLLLQKLPRLGELTFWCEFIKFLHTPSPHTVKWVIVSQSNRFPWTDGVYECYYENALVFGSVCPQKDGDMKILGHPFTHADILEALPGEWWLWIYRRKDNTTVMFLTKMATNWSFYKYWHGDDNAWGYVLLPPNISDLSLPEYEETRKQLISLLK